MVALDGRDGPVEVGELGGLVLVRPGAFGPRNGDMGWQFEIDMTPAGPGAAVFDKAGRPSLHEAGLPSKNSPTEVSARIRELAVRAFRALDCQGMARVDFFVTEHGPVINELNTLPGLTRRSFVPQQLQAEGTSMRKFLDGQLALARRRRDRR